MIIIFTKRCFSPHLIEKVNELINLIFPTDKSPQLTQYFVPFFAFRLEKFDHFSAPKHGYDNVNGEMDSPTSFDEIERPPLRHIDKYVRAEMFGLSARYTVALMAMMGFIISFGMKCNLSAAKSEREKSYNKTMNHVSFNYFFSYFHFQRHFFFDEKLIGQIF